MNLKKVTDSVLNDGHFILNNDNDLVNFIYRNCNSMTMEEVNEMLGKLKEVASKNDAKIYFVLGSEKLKDAILTWRQGNLYLSFKEVA